ncbi:MAG: class I SAM-dependent methyltransferase [Clostridia bacterium]|nr:class I SAM-dependent methyltransferase [Clostridia bacterium]
MYSEAFCKVYNEFGWNYYPEAFGEQLLLWLRRHQPAAKTSLDLACGTGILCEILHDHGLEASGMDCSEGLIDIARTSRPDIHYDVADMITYRPEKQFDLVTCTGDALNHIADLPDVEKIFRNVYAYLRPGGYFIFDLLNRREISTEEPFELDYSDTVKARIQMLQPEYGTVNLQIQVFENGTLQFQEIIRERVHEPADICDLLRKCGFEVVRCADQLLDDAAYHGTTWFLIAKK